MSRSQQAWLTGGLALAAFMIADTLYLLANRLAGLVGFQHLAAAETLLPRVFQVAILSHTAVGLVMAAVLLIFAVWHLPRVWLRRGRRALVTGIGVVLVGLVLAMTGLFIMTEANSRGNAWAWWTHIAAAALVIILLASHRWSSTRRPTPVAIRRFSGFVVVLTAAFLLSHGTTRRSAGLAGGARNPDAAPATKPDSSTSDTAECSEPVFASLAFVSPRSPFFPSPAVTGSGQPMSAAIVTRGESPPPEILQRDLQEYGFLVSVPIGAQQCARCHADIVAQWASSAHRFASFNNPFYESTVRDMRTRATAPNEWVEQHLAAFSLPAESVGMVKSKWCGACHDPALMLAGAMTGPVDRASPEAQAGLTCLACHAIDRIHNVTGNGNYRIADHQSDPYVFAYADEGLAAFLHDTALKARPLVHRARMLKPFFGTSEYCATCHKVSLDLPVNNYRWLRGQDEYDAWHDSGVAHNAARTFYLPPEPRRCQDCHMPPEPAVLGDVSAHGGMVRSHRFLAANTALPFIRGDDDTIRRIEEFLSGALTVDIFAIRHSTGLLICPLDRIGPPLVAGETVHLEVVVRNRDVGHTFPGGTNDSNEGWIELTVTDDGGEVVASLGQVRSDGYVDPSTHFYRAVILDRHGRPVLRRNAQDIYVTAYSNTIGPGSADVVRFRLQVPLELAGRQVTIQARLLWRKFNRAYTGFAYFSNPEGFKRFDAVPDLPVTELAADKVTLPVVAASEPAVQSPTPALAEDWMRFNDHGIGLLLQGDTRAAGEAFARVVRVAPERIDGHRNLTRVAVRDGNLAQAYTHLRACEKILPGDPQTAYFWGLALQEDGRYEEAAAAYRRTLRSFPNDRASWRNLGRTFYLDGRYNAAVEAFDQVLRIDPEDRSTHYHRMLIFKATGRPELAAAAEEAYEKYRIDESAEQLTLQYRYGHPEDNLEAQPIHVHDLIPRGMDSKQLSFAREAGPGQAEVE
ncbi:MAG: tetratricopeptide repeat protein [Phycisphaerales bacterium]|nr:MAG: tetratricopeptide repeat protein [Phycisphaerales bacterium]